MPPPAAPAGYPPAARRRVLPLSARLPPWAHIVRELLAPVLAGFLSYIFIVVRPLSNLAGEYAFLVNTSVILFYFPKGRISTIVENNTIDFMGAVAGLAWATIALAIAAWCGGHYGADTPVPRLILGLGLAVLSLGGGFLRSYAPRLNVACRAAMFYPIFLLTSEQDITKYKARLFLDQFFVTLFAYIFATASGVLCSEHSSAPKLGIHISSAVDTMCELIPTSLHMIFEGCEPDTDENRNNEREQDELTLTAGSAGKELEEQRPSERTRQETLARQLRSEITAMRHAYTAYSLDIVHAHHPPSSLKPITRIFAKLQRNALLMPTGHVPGDRIRNALERAHASPISPVVSHHLSRTHSPVRSMRHTRSGSRLSTSSSRMSVRSAFDLGDSSSTPTRPRHHHRDTSLSPTRLVHELSKVATHSHQSSRHTSGGGPHESAALSKLSATCSNLTDAIIAAFQGASALLTEACDWHWRNGHPSPPIPELKSQLNRAVVDLQKRLSGILDHEDPPPSPTDIRVTFADQIEADWLDDEDRFRIAFFMIALLDLARDTRMLLDYAAKLQTSQKPKRWFLPAISWPWTPMKSDTPLPSIDREVLTGTGDDEADRYNDGEDLDYVNALLRESRETSKARPRMSSAKSFGDRFVVAWRSVWDRSGMVLGRVIVSHALHSLKHSRHVHFALKQTVGISLLSLPAFLPPGNPGRVWYDLWRGAWMVNSFMYVLEVTTGATLRVGFYRMCGTFIGALVGFIFTKIAGANPYGLVALCTAAQVPISYAILFTEVAPMAIVSGVTLGPIVFLQYLGLTEGKSQFTIAWVRFVMIVIGIAAAVLIGMWVWPIHARVRYFVAVADIMDQITEYYLRMSRDLLRPSPVYRANSKQYSKIESSVRRHIERSRMLVDIQKQEISLLPRPIRLYSEIIDTTERLIETFTEVRVLRFSLPRQATVLDVLPIRREFVSAVLVNIWACGQAFRSRSPLPQLLPSPRVPLGEVMEATDEHAHSVRTLRARENRRRQLGELADDTPRTDRSAGATASADLAVLYGMAENEALGDIVNSIDELLAAARTLFGSKSFLESVDADHHSHHTLHHD